MLKQGEEHFFGNVNQKALIRKEGKVLLVQYPDDATKHDKRACGKWDMPGGRLNKGEDVLVGLRREVLEEIGVEVLVKGILKTGIFISLSGTPNYFVIYDCELIDEKENFVPEEAEVGKIEWFKEEDVLKKPIIYPEYEQALRSILL